MTAGIKGIGDRELKAIAARVAAKIILEYGDDGMTFLYHSGRIGAAFASYTWVEICAELEKKK